MNRYLITFTTADGLTNQGRIEAATEAEALEKAAGYTWSGRATSAELECTLVKHEAQMTWADWRELSDEERNARKVAKVGAPVTMSWYSDQHAGTIVKISPSGRYIDVQRDYAVRTDKNGMSDSQSYDYYADPQGAVQRCYRDSNGNYNGKGFHVTIGTRREYHDYGF